MLYLETSRLILATTPLPVLQRRLVEEAFTVDVVLGETVRQITFPAEWPGDALMIFPMQIVHRERHPEQVGWDGMIVDRAEGVAVGTMGTKGMPDLNGDIEIGYGINPAYQGCGYATEIGRALVEFLLAQPNVRRVLAETLTDNQASMRVLQKLGFARVGERVDEEDGPLFIWARET